MPILPLPQFEADLEAARQDAEAYARLATPKTLVVRFGSMKLVGEYPYDGDAKPGCGSKIVVRTHRGTEMGEMLTSTCPNNGCSKSVSRSEMLEYIENSGGKDYPFFTEGRALRVATLDDMNQQSRLEAQKPAMLKFARETAAEMLLPMKIVEAEPILGGERLTFYYTSEDRIDFRDLVHALAAQYHTRIDLRQVGARDEARLIADYEKCGQHCCCKQFLKVLKPISIKAAKTQKATLDPMKISGRCGRLMCCLRYEDQTYEELNKRLPKMKKRVGTPHGVGIVVDRQILTQLVLVRLEHDNSQVAVPAEEIIPPDQAPQIAPAPPVQPRFGGDRGRGPGGPGGPGGPAGPSGAAGPASPGAPTGPRGPSRDAPRREDRRDPPRERPIQDRPARDASPGELTDQQRAFRERDRQEEARQALNRADNASNSNDDELDDADEIPGDQIARDPAAPGEPREPGDRGAAPGGDELRRKRRRRRGRGPRPEGGGGPGTGGGGGGGDAGPGAPPAPRPPQGPQNGPSPQQPRREGPSGGGGPGGGGGGGRRRRRRKGPPFGGGGSSGGGSGGGGSPFGG